MRTLFTGLIITVLILSFSSFQLTSQHDKDGQGPPEVTETEEPAGSSEYIESIAILPDTQYYTTKDSIIRTGYRNYYAVQAAHITGAYGGNMLAHNIKAVIHLGDHINWTKFPGILNSDWDKVTEAWNIFPEHGMQFLPVEGNHDSDDGDSHGDFEKNFASLLSAYRETEWYVGSNQGIRNLALNSRINGRDYIFISLEYKADPEDLEWANKIINDWIPRNLPEARVIIVTHSYLKTEKENDEYRLSYTAYGEELWDGLIKNNSRIDFVICGHMMGDMVRLKNRLYGTVSYPENQIIENFTMGDNVFEILIDYQDDKNGGNGWYKIFKFDSETNRIYMDVERPGDNSVHFTHKNYPRDPSEHNFIINYP